MSNARDVGREVLDKEVAGLTAIKDSLSDQNSELAAALDQAVSAFCRLDGQIIVTGMGKSGHVGRKIASTLASTGTKASFVHPGEASHGDLGMISDVDIILALSNSGETTELGDIIAYAERYGIKLIAITSDATSTLGKAADIVLCIPKVEEACIVTQAPTTSTTQMMALGDMLSVATLREKGFTARDFYSFHPGGKLGAAMKRVADLMHHKKIPLCSDDMPVSEAVDIMTEGGFGCVGVTNANGALVGIITDGDLRRNFAVAGTKKTAQDIMTKDPHVIQADTLAAEALHLFSTHKITALFIVEDGRKPIGLLHVHDCLSTGVI